MVNADNYFLSSADQDQSSSKINDIVSGIFGIGFILLIVATIFGWFSPNSNCGGYDSTGDMISDCSTELADEYQLEQIRDRN